VRVRVRVRLGLVDLGKKVREAGVRVSMEGI
jgi:hypothetical protein